MLEIGAVVKPHGIRGEVAVEPFAESDALFRGEVFLQQGKAAPRAMTARALRPHQGRLLIQFEGVEDRTAADALRGAVILVPEDRLPELSSDETYLYEIVGMRVVLAENGETVGVVSAVDPDSPQELWRISAPDGRELLFPAVPEFVREIDAHEGVVRIAPPPGLFDIQ